MMYYDKLFKLLEWTDEEIESGRKKIEYCLEKIECTTQADIDHAIEHIHEQFDVTIPGVCKLMGINVHEFVDACNIKNEYKYYVAVNYPVLPGIALGLQFAQYRSKLPVAVKSCSHNAIIVLGMVFDKYTRVLEAGELIGQAAGKAHCAQYQAEAGLLELGILPIPDLVLASGWCCDQGAEADELLGHRFGFESMNLEGTMDWSWDATPDKCNIEYSAKSMRRAFARIEEVTGLHATDEDDAAAWEHFGNVSAGVFTLLDMIGRSDPQCMSHADASWVYFQSICVPSLDRADDVLDSINLMIEEAGRRIDEEIGILPKGAPKVYVGMRSGCDAKNIKVIEESGLSITNLFLDGAGRRELEAPIIPDGDRYDRAVEFFFKRPGLGCIYELMVYQKDNLINYDCDGVVLSYLFNCRPWAGSPMMGKDYIEKETGKPVLVLETDYYDNRLYSAEQQRTRVESFAEILKMNKAMQ